MRINLDTQLSTPQAVGVRAGVAASRITGSGSQIAELHRRVADAADAGLLPHVTVAHRPEWVTEQVARGAAWRGRGKAGADRVIVVGEPGAAHAATLLARTLGVDQLVIVDQPDGRLVQAALAGARRPRLVVLDGPPWVRSLAAVLHAQVGATILFVDGQDDVPSDLAGAEVVESVGAADPRFGVLGAAALSLAGWAGGDAEELVDALRDVAETCSTLAIRSNPALRLAVLSDELYRQHDLGTPALLTGGPALGRWAVWASRCWAAISARPVPVSGGYQARGSAPLAVSLGDEALTQRLVAGPRDLWVLAVQSDADGADDLARVARGLLDTHVRQLVRGGRPVLRLVVRDDSASTLVQLAWLWTHAAVLAAALDPVDPLTMDAADDWRRMLADASTR